MDQAGLLPRIAAKAGAAFAALAEEWSAEAPDPSLALSTLDRWLAAVASPAAYTQQMMDAPVLGALLLKVMGSSTEIGSCLVQNPEFAGLCLDPSLIGQPVEPASLSKTGQRMLAHASSYTHQLDRLRLLKQEVMVRIAVADQAKVWASDQVWEAISAMADVLIALAKEAAWKDFSQSRELPPECPVGIVGMGKLGGQELNYSSDIDLIYMTPDNVDDKLLVQCIRFAEKLGRALSDRMGRGALFRVDMRLRPFGRSGDLVARMRAIEAYMDRYAEPWEHMALIRSRLICGPEGLEQRWEAMREAACFKRKRSLEHIHSILRMRQRLEQMSSDRDIKRSQGGIRDIEFGVQLLQLFFGGSHPRLRTRGTLEALKAAAEDDHLPLLPPQAAELAEGYRFLRGVEHQLQVSSGRQTHDLPESEQEITVLARRLGYQDAAPFLEEMRAHRARVSAAYQQLVLVYQPGGATAKAVARAAAGPDSALLDQWVGAQPDPDALWASLAENEGSLDRFCQVIQTAPALLPGLRQSEAATELVVSGEGLEPPPPLRRASAGALATHWLACGLREALAGQSTFGEDWSEVVGQCLSLLHKELECPFAIIALGSLAERGMSLHSDADLVFVAPQGVALSQAEAAASKLMNRLADLRSAGSPLQADARLRPEGRNGPLAATPESLAIYAAGRMEPWERLAASRMRLITGPPEAAALLASRTLASGLSMAELVSLLHIKGRVESERAQKTPGMLDIKLGMGGLDDCAWAVHLWALARPLESGALAGPTAAPRGQEEMTERLAEAGVLSQHEAAILNESAALWRRTRVRLGLLGMPDSLLPVGQAKLTALGFPGDPLAIAARTREVYLGLVERLKAALSS